MFLSVYNNTGMSISVDGVFWSHIIIIASILHSAIWSMIEFDTLPRNTPYKVLKLMYTAFIYWVSAAVVGLIILFGIMQIDVNQKSTTSNTIQIISAVSSVILFIIIIIKLSRWLLGIVRGHNTLIDNFLVCKRLISELIKQEQETEMSRCSTTNIVPQNERNVNMLGAFITHRRQELGLSLAKLAKISGHPVSSIHGNENGDNQNPRFEMIIDLCQALDVSLDEMKAAFIDKEPQNTNHSTH